MHELYASNYDNTGGCRNVRYYVIHTTCMLYIQVVIHTTLVDNCEMSFK